MRIFARGQGVSPCKNFFAEIFFDRKKLSDKEYSCLYNFLHKNYSTIIFNFNDFFCYNLQNEKKVKGKKVSKLDGLKEDLKFLRFWLGISVASFLAIIGWIATNYNKTELWLLVASSFVLIVFVIVIFLITKKMRKIIKKIYKTRKDE